MLTFVVVWIIYMVSKKSMNRNVKFCCRKRIFEKCRSNKIDNVVGVNLIV